MMLIKQILASVVVVAGLLVSPVTGAEGAVSWIFREQEVAPFCCAA